MSSIASPAKFVLTDSLVTSWRIQKRIDEQFQNFAQGFNELIPQDLINVFDERELELLIGGIAEMDVDDWKKHTDYRGYTESDDVVQWFWKVSYPLNPSTKEQKRLTFKGNTDLGCGEKVSVTAVYNWNFTNPRQRI
jgi:E3 ubiquitin-protein ligase NEDD4